MSNQHTEPWLPLAADVGDLDGKAEAPLKGPEQVIAAFREEQVRRGISPKYQSTETGFDVRTILRGMYRKLGEADWRFLRRYITHSGEQPSASQLRAAYEKANKDQKPDWETCGAAKKSEVLEQALKQCVKDDLDVYALSNADRDKLANLFTNCNGTCIRLFMGNSMNLLPIAGAKPRSLEIKLQAARDARGDEPKVKYRGPILDAVGAVLKVGDGDDDDFDAARKATTLRERVGEFSSVVEVRRAAVKQELEELAARLRAEEESCSEKAKPSLAEVAADVRALAAETAVELSVEARPQFAARRLEGGVWSEWDPCGTIIDVKKSLGLPGAEVGSKVSDNLVRGLLGLYPLSKKNAHLREILEVEPYDPTKHGTYDAARVAARFDNGSAFRAVEAALASEEEESSRAASLVESSPAAVGRLPPVDTRCASASAALSNADAIGETARLRTPPPSPTSLPQVAGDSPALATLATDFRGALDEDNAGKPARKAQRSLASSGGVSRGVPTARPSPVKPRTRSEDPPTRRLPRAARAVQEKRRADALRVESLLKHVRDQGAEPVVEVGWEPTFVEALDEAGGNVVTATYLLWKGDHIKTSPHEYG